MSYPTTGALLRIAYQNPDTGERHAEIRANLNVIGEIKQNGSPIGSDGTSFAMETPTGAVNGSNDRFVFTSPPIIVFRNGVNETRLGTIEGNAFTFGSPPETGDDIEGLV